MPVSTTLSLQGPHTAQSVARCFQVGRNSGVFTHVPHRVLLGSFVSCLEYLMSGLLEVVILDTREHTGPSM